ncbi:hypothetical protein LIER_15192 [Lithospermum erythrorhizon]|uniref:Uncharacterized protein n=1 Tax=Lithospermum erythrorhizon TaxID=34254 RepID=A0AAV3Q602_LITER
MSSYNNGENRYQVVDTKTTIDELEKDLSNIIGLNQLKQQLRIWAKGLVLDEPKREKIEEVEGGILFVDEAYQLMIPECRNDFGKQALEEIMSAKESGKVSFIFSGYVGPMKTCI